LSIAAGVVWEFDETRSHDWKSEVQFLRTLDGAGGGAESEPFGYAAPAERSEADVLHRRLMQTGTRGNRSAWPWPSLDLVKALLSRCKTAYTQVVGARDPELPLRGSHGGLRPVHLCRGRAVTGQGVVHLLRCHQPRLLI
jgi:hypothetical protein